MINMLSVLGIFLGVVGGLNVEGGGGIGMYIIWLSGVAAGVNVADKLREKLEDDRTE